MIRINGTKFDPEHIWKRSLLPSEAFCVKIQWVFPWVKKHLYEYTDYNIKILLLVMEILLYLQT